MNMLYALILKAKAPKGGGHGLSARVRLYYEELTRITSVKRIMVRYSICWYWTGSARNISSYAD